jgi:hypothetical protein
MLLDDEPDYHAQHRARFGRLSLPKGEEGGEGSFIVSQRGEPQPLTLILSPPAGERQKACAAKLNTLAIIEVSFCRGS